MKTNTKLCALALAATAFTTITLVAGTASAGNVHGPAPKNTVTTSGPRPVHGPVPPYTITKAPPSIKGGLLGKGGTVNQVLPKGSGSSAGTKPGSSGGTVVSCHPGTGCTVTPTPTHGDRDHDGYHRHDRWYGWRETVMGHQAGPLIGAAAIAHGERRA